mmetsp:Transcript_15397/g.23288  ORF Transcript_15397/g.23288 Transcript_15397/m.23288 type:complete len:574 (-) Transcript_15397:62-1783(-)
MDDKDDKKQGFRMKKTLELTPIEILYLIPGHVCVVNKPPDVFIEKCKGNEGVTAIDMTKEALKQKGYDHSYFHFINRLDFATSGVMVFGLSRIAAGVGTECFANRRARKVYVAIVEGHVPESWDRGIYIDSPLAQSPKSDFLQVLGSESNPGKTCLTQVLAVQRGTLGNEKVSKVLIWIRSGRRHQIRVHLSKAGHPIVGDATYGAGYPLANSSRMALHAWKLSMDLRSSTRNQRKRKNEDAQKFGPVAVEAKDPFKSMIQPMKDSNEKKQLELSERLKWVSLPPQEPSINFPAIFRPQHLAKYRSTTIVFISDGKQGELNALLHNSRKGDTIKGRWVNGFSILSEREKPMISKARRATDFDSADLCSSIYENNSIVQEYIDLAYGRSKSKILNRMEFGRNLRECRDGICCINVLNSPSPSCSGDIFYFIYVPPSVVELIDTKSHVSRNQKLVGLEWVPFPLNVHSHTPKNSTQSRLYVKIGGKNMQVNPNLAAAMGWETKFAELAKVSKSTGEDVVGTVSSLLGGAITSYKSNSPVKVKPLVRSWEFDRCNPKLLSLQKVRPRVPTGMTVKP